MDNDIKRRKAAKSQPDQANDLGMQNVIRQRYAKDWPNVVLQLMKRVEGVNKTWMSIMGKLLHRQDMKISYYRRGDHLVVETRVGGEVQYKEISLAEVAKAKDHIEVLVMDAVMKSKLMER